MSNAFESVSGFAAKLKQIFAAPRGSETPLEPASSAPTKAEIAPKPDAQTAALASDSEILAGDIEPGQNVTRSAALSALRSARSSAILPTDRRWFFAVAEIDRLTSLRTTIGDDAASLLLEGICERARSAIAGCEIGRAGGEHVEFAFTAASLDDAREQILRLIAVTQPPFAIAGIQLETSITVGCADAGGNPITEVAVGLAEQALRHARANRSKVAVWDKPLDDGAADRLQLVWDLQQAAQLGQLDIRYQPKMRCRTGEVDTVEALIRWYHPVRGEMAPDQFIPLAEATGKIRALTEWVIARAKADHGRLRARGYNVEFDINISGILLPDAGFAEFAIDTVGDCDGAIGFEITETALISEPDRALANLIAFSNAGIKLIIDDYGAGFSSLAYIQTLPVRELKIDRLFISGLAKTHRDPLIVRSTIDLAHALEMEVTAEGVDTPEALALLQVMGCDLVQGYLIGKPLCLDDLEHFIRTEQHRTNVAASPSQGDTLRRLLSDRARARP